MNSKSKKDELALCAGDVFSRLAEVSKNLPKGAHVSAWVTEPPDEWKRHGCTFDLNIECKNPGPTKKGFMNSVGVVLDFLDPLVESVFLAFSDFGTIHYIGGNNPITKVTVFLYEKTI